MVGISRTRTRGGNYINGSIKVGDLAESFTSVQTSLQVCRDVIGNPMLNNPLDIESVENEPCILDGTNGLSGSSGRTFRNYPAGGTLTVPGHAIFSEPFRDATQSIASSHPGESRVSLPNFLYELKDLPRMLKTAAARARALHEFWAARKWKVSHRRLANYYSAHSASEDYLNYIFGWVPFFSDLKDMMEIDDFLKHRKKKFKSVKGSELKTSGTLGSHSARDTRRWSLQSFGYAVDCTRNIVSSRERWWAAQWRIDPARFGETLTPGYRNSLQDFLGLDNSLPLQIWNAMPWTWLSDWAFNVQSILKLMGNWQGCQFKGAVVMTHTRSEMTYTPIYSSSWLKITDGKQVRDTKIRVLFSPSITRTDAGYNIFQPQHLATLGALKVTRLRGSSRF